MKLKKCLKGFKIVFKKRILILAGPTGVGKTNLSIKLAKSINGEIISADSMQIYKNMDIGSAKISEEEMHGIKHHLISVVEPDQEFNVAIYVDLAKRAIDEIISRNKIPIIVGGTGLYIRSLIYDQKHCTSGEDKNYRENLYNLALKKGNLYVHNLLKKIDIESYTNIHFNNLKRVIRALEVYHITGKPFSSFKENNVKPIFDFKYYVLDLSRDELYNNINRRVEIMIENGLIDEVKYLKQKGYTKEMQSMQGIGYKEVFEYLENNITFDKMVEKIQQNSRNYAKRQLTWFKKEISSKFISRDKMSEDEILKYIIEDFNRS